MPGLIREPIKIEINTADQGKLFLEGLVVRPARPGKFPLIMMNHGTHKKVQESYKATPYAFEDIAIDFATRGWAAVVVMREGYGQSQGPLKDRAGLCEHGDYQRIAAMTAADISAALNFLEHEPWVDSSRMVLLGHSAGGLGVSAVAAQNPKGVVGILDFAGGHGSNERGAVCKSERLVDAFNELGKTARIPSLWLYSKNDHFFEPDLAKNMFNAYTVHHAPAQFILLPASGNDGHQLLFASKKLWWPPVEKFLVSLNLPVKIEITLPELPRLPPPANISISGLKGFRHYLDSYTEIKVFAVGSHGFGMKRGARTVEEAKQNAMENCEKYTENCSIYAVGNQLAR